MLKFIVGLTAASLTTIALVPQALKTWKTKSTDDLSPFMYLLFCIGIAGWFTYGIFLKDFIMIVANLVSLGLAISIMYFILNQKFKRKISHIAIWANNIEDLKDFYCTNLNGKSSEKYENQQKDYCSYFISFTSGPRLEIMGSISGMKTLTSPKPHIAISIGNKKNINKLTKQLEKDGIKIISQPQKTGNGYYKSVIADPEGNIIELTI